ncbi:MAG: hypothetical protein HFG29_00635 [Eubacterium sp.]|nr:hypothetical protein [Eubacterium sp.]
MFDKVANWLNKVLSQDILDDVVAFCFNLYDDGDNRWSMELVGTERFDEDDDWPCDEITDFGTREGLLAWSAETDWEAVLEEICSVLKQYLDKGEHANILKSKEGIGVGFVDGDVEILFVR